MFIISYTSTANEKVKLGSLQIRLKTLQDEVVNILYHML
jgi:hypothetical protein